MTDPRILDWLTVTEQAAGAPSDRLAEAVVEASRRREEIRLSLTAKPPTEGPDTETAKRLERAEARLAEVAASERARLAQALEEVQRQKAATSGYRPARSSLPVFLSRKA